MPKINQVELEEIYDKTNPMPLGDIIGMLTDENGEHFNYKLGMAFMEAQDALVMELGGN